MSEAEILEEYNERWLATQKEQDEQYVPEKYQLGILVDFLQDLGIQYATEQSIFSYPIDVLCVNGEETIAIELKSRNIGKGIDQALRNADYVDFSFLAIWEDDLSKNIIERVSDRPIGLLSVGESVNIITAPEKTGKQLYPNVKVVELVERNV